MLSMRYKQVTNSPRYKQEEIGFPSSCGISKVLEAHMGQELLLWPLEKKIAGTKYFQNDYTIIWH